MSTEVITSRQNALVSLVAGLADRKNRRREAAFRFDGRKLFLEALAYGLPLSAILLRESTAAEFLAVLQQKGTSQDCRVVLLADSLFARISEEKAPEGVICVSKNLDKIHKIVTIDKRCDQSDLFLDGPALFLESVRDPGNLGTIIRSAKAFGIGNVVLSSDCADLYHPKTLRAAMGTLFGQPVTVVDDMVAAIGAWRAAGRRVFAAALNANARRLGELPLLASDAVVVGNEGHGLSPEVMGAVDDCIFIPMEAGVESLNAGIAASVLLWEFYRGR